MIDQATIQKIFDAADIYEVVSDFVSLKKRGVNYLGLCPFHNEKTGSFTVSPAKGEYVNCLFIRERVFSISTVEHGRGAFRGIGLLASTRYQ